MKLESAEVIAVGTEILLGQIPNTNAQWISKALASIGINVHHHAVVGDNLKRVEDQFRMSSERADLIIVTGGLGPTEDDLTREAFQNLTDLPLVEDEPSMEKIKASFNEKQEKMTENNKKQARVFSGAKVMPNNTGMAPGMLVTYNNKVWIFLPGVPREMKQIMTDTLPYLQNLEDHHMIIKSTMLHFTGIGESKLEDTLIDLVQEQNNPTIALLAQVQGISIRLTAKAESDDEANRLIEETKTSILERVGEFYYGTEDQTLEERVFNLLKENNMTLGAAESLTGGMFTDRLISLPGASSVCLGGIVCYDARIKKDVLNVSSDLIQQYGTISYECASAMARNIRTRMHADIGISFTGAAGPDTSEGNPAGTVFIGIDNKGEQQIEKYIFTGDRQAIREQSVLKAYELLLYLLK